MGMFDEVKCNMPLPDGRVSPGSWFQTKSLCCCMGKYTITAEGRLISHKYRYDIEGTWDARPGVMLPKYNPVHIGDVDMDYHGDISMCASTKDDTFVEYVVRFTHGTVEWIRPYDELPEIHKTWFYAKD